jgi:tRNA(Ile)-lysidine synthase
MSSLLKPLAPLEAARLFIKKIQKPTRILVAISGGSDSTGLLLALHLAIGDAGRDDILLQAVTIDHALRPEAAEEARGVAALCAQFGIVHHVRRWDEPKPKTGISAAARLARYSLIGAVAGEIHADLIVVGHTLGDQQETIAMRSARSVREDNLGLAGMADAVLYHGRHWIVRPFLNSTRQDIRDFLADHGQTWYDDPSNDDAKYERVRLRNLPAEVPVEVIDHARKRSELSALAAQLIERHTESHHQSLIKIRAEGLREEPAILRYALSALASVIGGRRFAVSADSMDRVMGFVGKGQPGRVTASRVVFDRRKEGLYLVRENRDVPSLHISAGATGVWDERFEITNTSAVDVVVGGSGVASVPNMLVNFPSSVPSGVATRAWQTMPVFQDDSGGVTIRPMLAPYDLFLPRLDLGLANAIAHLLGRSAYPQPPV